MISTLVTTIVIGLVAGVFWWAVGALTIIPPPVAQVIRVFIVVVAVLYVLSVLLGHSHGLYWGASLP